MTEADGGTPAASDARLRVRLVLGSGGIRPVAAVPLLEFLDREGIEVDEIVGCSGGAVIASLYGCGLRGPEMRRVLLELLRPQLFTDIDPRAPWRVMRMLMGCRTPEGLLRASRIRTAYRIAFGQARLEGLPRRIVLQATTFEGRLGVTLSSGALVDALYASTAAYPLFAPALIDGAWLIDGAFSAPLPLQGSGAAAALTIAVSGNPPGMRNVADRLLRLPDDPPNPANDDSESGYLVLRPTLGTPVRWLDTHRLPELFAVGEATVAQHAGELRTALAACA